MKRIFASAAGLAQLAASATAAQAHGGHVGELAGHAHWVGIAALGAAVALAASIALAGRARRGASQDHNADTAGAAPKESAA